jgi:hypothetical protein
MSGWARGLLAWAMVGLAPVSFDALAQRADAPESRVKAEYLYKFAGYIDWAPAIFASPDAPFVIGVVAANEVASELEVIVVGRSIAGRPVLVKRIREGWPLKGIHLLFAGRGGARPASLIKAAQAQGALTVTEAEGGLDLGSAINFVVADDRVGFEVSLDSVEKNGHRVSSRMLAVARRVVPRP